VFVNGRLGAYPICFFKEIQPYKPGYLVAV